MGSSHSNLQGVLARRLPHDRRKEVVKQVLPA
jgi:hypothetical protein